MQFSDLVVLSRKSSRVESSICQAKNALAGDGTIYVQCIPDESKRGQSEARHRSLTFTGSGIRCASELTTIRAAMHGARAEPRQREEESTDSTHRFREGLASIIAPPFSTSSQARMIGDWSVIDSDSPLQLLYGR